MCVVIRVCVYAISRGAHINISASDDLGAENEVVPRRERIALASFFFLPREEKRIARQ